MRRLQNFIDGQLTEAADGRTLSHGELVWRHRDDS